MHNSFVLSQHALSKITVATDSAAGQFVFTGRAVSVQVQGADSSLPSLGRFNDSGGLSSLVKIPALRVEREETDESQLSSEAQLDAASGLHAAANVARAAARRRVTSLDDWIFRSSDPCGTWTPIARSHSCPLVGTAAEMYALNREGNAARH